MTKYVRPETRRHLATAVFVIFDPWHLHNKQKCRFCGKGTSHFVGLWRYARRHYACDDCRKSALAQKTIKQKKHDFPLDTSVQSE